MHIQIVVTELQRTDYKYNDEQGTCTYTLGLKGQDPWEEQTVHSRHCQGWWYSIEHEEKYMTECKLYNDNL